MKISLIIIHLYLLTCMEVLPLICKLSVGVYKGILHILPQYIINRFRFGSFIIRPFIAPGVLKVCGGLGVSSSPDSTSALIMNKVVFSLIKSFKCKTIFFGNSHFQC